MVSQAGIAAEPLIRLGAFLGVFAMVALWEALAPRRRAAFARRARWPHNLGLLVLDGVVLRLVAPGAAIAVAIAGEAHGWGLVNALAMPAWIAIPLAIVLLDLAVYFQHVTFHAVPALWRLHRVHHTDLDFDVTTGTRFHPIEILLSTLIKMAAVVAIGAPALAVLVFEVLLNATAMFNHANGTLPVAIDRWLRLARRDAGHAPRASLGGPQRDQQQFRVQRALVGPAVRDLPRAAGGRARSDDDRRGCVPDAR